MYKIEPNRYHIWRHWSNVWWFKFHLNTNSRSLDIRIVMYDIQKLIRHRWKDFIFCMLYLHECNQYIYRGNIFVSTLAGARAHTHIHTHKHTYKHTYTHIHTHIKLIIFPKLLEYWQQYYDKIFIYDYCGSNILQKVMAYFEQLIIKTVIPSTSIIFVWFMFYCQLPRCFHLQVAPVIFNPDYKFTIL